MRQSNRAGVFFDGYVVRTTDAAVLFCGDGWDEAVWFPLSVVELDESETSIWVPRWLCAEKGLQ